MTDRGSTPGSPGGPGGQPEPADDAREADLMREVLREQEEHREGGVEPGLGAADPDPDPGPGDQDS